MNIQYFVWLNRLKQGRTKDGCASVAQLAEQAAFTREVGGSLPSGGTKQGVDVIKAGLPLWLETSKEGV